MPQYTLTDTVTGRVVTVERPSPPSEEEAARYLELPQFRAPEEPGVGARALQKMREALSPVLGETDNQTLRREQQSAAFAAMAPEIAAHVAQQPGTETVLARMEGGAPTAIEQAVFTPAPGTPQIPMIPQQEGKAAQIGAGVVNTLSSVVNTLPTPGGLVAGMGRAPAAAVLALGAPSLARGTVEGVQTLADSDASLQEKATAGTGLALVAAGGVVGARQLRKVRVAEAGKIVEVPEGSLPGAFRAVVDDAAPPAAPLPDTVPAPPPVGQTAARAPEIAAPSATAKPLGLLESAKQSPDILPEVKAGLAGFYEPQSNKVTLAEATKRIDAAGDLQSAKSQVLRNESPDAVTQAMGLELVRKFQIENRLDDASDLLFDMARKAKTQGQAIQILSTLSRGTPDGMAAYAARLLDRKLTAAELAEINAGMKRVAAAQSPEVRFARQADLLEQINSKVPASLGEKLRAAQNMSMLLNPKTLVRNVGGNVLMAFGELGSDVLVPAVDSGVSVFTGRRTASGPQMVEYFKGLAQPARDFAAGYKQGQYEGATRAQSAKEGFKTMATLAKLTSSRAVQLSDINSAYRTVFSQPLLRMMEKGLTVGLGVPDRAFYTARLRASLRSQMKAADAAAPTGAMLDRAALEAARAIYQDPNFVSARLNEIRRTLNFGDKRQFGLGQVILPFTQVPGSLLLRGVEYSPAGFVRAAYRQIAPESWGGVKGFDQRAFVQDFSRALSGTAALTATGYYLSKLGVVTGAPDDDRDVEAVRRTLGVGAYRINVSELKRRMQSMDWSTPAKQAEVGDVMVSYDWAQPVAFPVALGADLADSQKRNQQRAVSGRLVRSTSDVLNAIISGARTIEEQPMLTGLSGFFSAAANAARGEGAGTIEALYGSMLNLPGVFLPTAVRGMQHFIDNRVYETRGTDAMESAYLRTAANVPGVASALGFSPRNDVFGEAASRYQANGNTAFNVFINPAFVSRVQSDPQLRELYRIWQQTGERSQLPRVVDQKITINGQQRVLTAPEVSDYQQFVGRLTRDGFRTLMSSGGYRQLPDEARAKVLAQFVSSANTAAKVMLFGDRPKRLDQLDEALIGLSVLRAPSKRALR